MGLLTSNVRGLVAVCALAPAAAGAQLSIPDTPLAVTAAAPPNVMLLLDNSGSMQNIVPDVPFDPQETYVTNCPAPLTADGLIELVIRSGRPAIRTGGNVYTFGTGTGNRCFISGATYTARLYVGDRPSLPATYSGNYLNWYFDPFNTTPDWTSGQPIKPGTQSRMDIAKEAALALVDGLGGVKAGLASYNGGDGAVINVGVDHIANNRAAMRSKINSLVPAGNTPLAESLRDIGRYFVQGFNNPLLIHPGQSGERQVSAYTLFDHEPRYESGVLRRSPVANWCEKSFGVLLTDGRPQADRDMNSILADYDGDCAGGGCLSFDRKRDRDYEPLGSDYLDDVALALHEIDLRPDLVNDAGDPVKNNMTIYTIGFADDQVINDPLMQDTAANGGGRFLIARDAASLQQAFEEAAADILANRTSAAPASVSGGVLTTDTRVFFAFYNSVKWTGQLTSYRLGADGLLSRSWDGGEQLDALNNPVADRNILTYSAEGRQGIPFRWTQLDAAQQAALNRNSAGEDDGNGMLRLAYLRGDRSNEGAGANFRSRSSLLGDIVHSGPYYVGPPAFNYPDDLEPSAYSAFRNRYLDRPPMVYVGANDGMLHGFHAETGREVLAYVPNLVFSGLSGLTDPNYTHKYTVDGSPTVADAYVGGRWRSILVAGLRKGGRGMFALDVTDPRRFSESLAENLALWEFTDPDLGYTYSQPSIVRLSSGRWVVVFGSGYDDGGAGTLFVVDLTDGSLIRKMQTPQGSGLATPAVADVNGDGIADVAYGGDLNGNLWRFELGGTWSVQRLFEARDSSGGIQPITAKPEIGVHPEPGRAGQIVYFGTGKFLETTDTRTAVTQSFYAVWDDGSGSTVGRDDLQQQTINRTATVDGNHVRLISRNTIDWTRHKGWRLDLAANERAVADPVLRRGRIVFPTIVPETGVCSFGGTSWLMELNAYTGGALQAPPFDLNGDGLFGQDDTAGTNPAGDEGVGGRESETGMTNEPAIVHAGDKEFKASVGSSGETEVVVENPGGRRPGRQTWQEL